MTAPLVQVEVRLSGGLPTFQVAGAAEGALRDLRDRVHSALSAAGYAFPQGRITVNLAPRIFLSEAHALISPWP